MVAMIPARLAANTVTALDEEARQPGRFSGPRLLELVTGCEMLANVLERCYQFAEELGHQGAEASRVKTAYRELAEIMDKANALFATVALKVGQSESDDAAKGQASTRLTEYQTRCERWLSDLHITLNWLDSHRLKVDTSRLPTDTGERGSSDYVSLDSFLQTFPASR